MVRSALYGLLVFVVFTACSRPDEFFLESGTAGPFRLEMPLDEALQIANNRYRVDTTTITLEGMESVAYDIWLDEELLLKLEPDFDSREKLWRMWVFSPRYRTDRGIGVGSSIQEVLSHYRLDFLQTEGEGFVFLRLQETDIGFALDPDALTLDWWEAGARFEEIPPDTRVVFILP